MSRYFFLAICCLFCALTLTLPCAPPAKLFATGFLIRAAAQAAITAAEMKPYTESLPGTNVKYEMIPIQAGTFTMGSPQSEKDKLKAAGEKESFYSNEVQHRVTLTRGFWMPETEITQAQWQAVMRTTLVEQAKKALMDDTLYTINGKKQTYRDSASQTDGSSQPHRGAGGQSRHVFCQS